MKFERTPQFDGDISRLSEEEYKQFRRVAKEDFSPACDRQRSHPAEAWPKKLRVKRVQGTENIYEMTWSFSGPDGRATFQWVSVDGEPRIRWRRVGSHKILKQP